MNRGSEKLEQDINVNTFQLGCTPAINLFEQTAEPIALDQSRHEYRVVPDVANQNGMEVYSVDQVTGVDPISGRTTEYQPFYSFRHGHASRNSRPSGMPRAARRSSRRIGEPKCT